MNRPWPNRPKSTSPPAKRTREAAKGRCEVELLQGEEEEEALQLSPLFCAPPSPSRLLSSRTLPPPLTTPKAAPFFFVNQLIRALLSSLTHIDIADFTDTADTTFAYIAFAYTVFTYSAFAHTVLAALAAKIPCPANTSTDRNTTHFLAESPLSGMQSCLT